MFSKQLITYTESTFTKSKIDILTKTMVKEVKECSIVLQVPDKSIKEVPCGLVVWAAGNKGRKVTRDLMAKHPAEQTNRRGITVDDGLRIGGAKDVFAIGDRTPTSYAPTAQVASQQGAYLARVLHQLAKKDGLEKELKKLEGLDVEGDKERARVQKEIAVMMTKVSKIQPKPFDCSHQIL
jgi:NADH:ubiquinone reductase (non-electrogenic)